MCHPPTVKRKIISKIAIAIILTVLISILSTAFIPTFNNEMALQQLENDNFAYTQVAIWYSIMKIVVTGGLSATVWLITFILIGVDIYKVYVEKKRKEEKEND